MKLHKYFIFLFVLTNIILIFITGSAALTFVLGVVETIISRSKMKNIPQYLLFATAIGILNLLIYTFTK